MKYVIAVLDTNPLNLCNQLLSGNNLTELYTTHLFGQKNTETTYIR